MVNKNNLVLDEGEIKYLPEAKMPIKLERKILYEVVARQQKQHTQQNWDSDEDDYHIVLVDNPDYKELSGKLKWWFRKWYEPTDEKHDLMDLYMHDFDRQRLKSWTAFYEREKDEIYNWLGRIPFNPCVMINISPNWKGKKITKMMIKQFTHTLDTYLRVLNRYSRWKYVLECGSTGDFLHCHCVAEINPDLINSVLNGKNSHIRKSNHFQEIRKIWDKKGHPGLLKGKYSIQSSILRTESLRDDKLEYLLEAKKQEGHKNLKDLGLLFNVGF